jgi:hypothetical protein
MLGELFVPGYAPIEPELEDKREALYQKIVSIRNGISAGSLAVVDLTGLGVGSVVVALLVGWQAVFIVRRRRRSINSSR